MPVIPRIISVDDHVVEPAHVWTSWLPRAFLDRAPRIERRGIGPMRHTGGGNYDITWDEAGPQADCWFFEDLVELSADPYAVDPHTLATEVSVLGTWVGGHRIDLDALTAQVEGVDPTPHRDLATEAHQRCCA